MINGRDNFVDKHRCPAGERLVWRFAEELKGLVMHRYWSSECAACDFKSQCTTNKERRIGRWEHEEVLDDVQIRLDRDPELMRTRRATVEHPFGTIKSWMGATHFQMRTLENVSTEMSLHVLAYNMKRVMKIMGIKLLLERIRELKRILRENIANLALSKGFLSRLSGLKKCKPKIRQVCSALLTSLRMPVTASGAEIA